MIRTITRLVAGLRGLIGLALVTAGAYMLGGLAFALIACGLLLVLDALADENPNA